MRKNPRAASFKKKVKFQGYWYIIFQPTCCIIPVTHEVPSHKPRFLGTSPVPDLYYL